MSTTGDDLDLHVRALPQSIEPQRDLWPEIELQLTADSPKETRGGRRRQWQILSAAAGLLLTITLGAQFSGPLSESPEPGPAPHDNPGNLMTASLTIGSDLRQTRQALASNVYQRLADLPPETRQVVAENLAAINRALDEIDEALESAPQSGLDRHLLLIMYTDQLALLNAMSPLLRYPTQELAL